MESSVPSEPVASDGVYDHQTLQVAYKNWKSDFNIRDSQDNLLYLLETSLTSFVLKFKAADRDSVAGICRSKLTSTKITVELPLSPNPTTIEVAPKRMFSRTYQYASPAFNNQVMRWKLTSGMLKFEFHLLDESDNTVAKFETEKKSLSKVGKLDILNSVLGETGTANKVVLDEIVVIGMTLAWITLTGTLGVVAG